MIDTEERPVRTLTTRFIVEHLLYGKWVNYITCKDAVDGLRIISEFDHIASARPSRVVRVSTATEREIVAFTERKGANA